MPASSQPPSAPSPADPVSVPALSPLPESARRVTIRDVAARAGVSTGTASKALNGQGKLRAETRGRVAAAARELGFAANVLARVRRDALEAKGTTWSAEEEAQFTAPIREQYDRQGHPYYATARLWDDGIIDPADTRRVLALGLSASLNAPIPATRFGIFRM